jgi:hypothetical protein
MAEVRFHNSQLSAQAFPDVCAKSGEPAAGRIKMTLAWAPPWAAIFILFGVLPFIIVYYLAGKRVKFQVPAAQRFVTRRSIGRFVLWAGFLGGLALLGYGAAEGSGAAAGYGVLIAFLGLLVGSIWMNAGWIRGRLDDQLVILKKVDPTFAAGMAQRIAITIDGNPSYPPPPSMPPPPPQTVAG